MADELYRRLSCDGCGVGFAQLITRGRPAKYCMPTCKRADPKPRKAYTPKNPTPATCAWPACGTAFMRTLPHRRFCGDACRLAGNNREAQERRRDRSPRPCGHCAAQFAPTYGDRREAYCTPACRVKAGYARKSGHTHVRRAKQLGCVYDVTLDKWAVFERDGWKCQMCGCDTPKHLSGSKHPNAPELDHMVALKLGGSHTTDNVCCLCQTCNGIKRDLPLDVAIDLIAKKMESGHGARRI